MSLANLLPATVTPTATVFPQSLSTHFVERQIYSILGPNSYHDKSNQRSIIQDGVNLPRPLRTWELAKRLDFTDLSTLKTFFQVTVQGGWLPFYFYDPFAGTPFGSNYDPAGNNSVGQVTVVFQGNWRQQLTVGRINVPGLLLQEIA